jgi:hypothetical protein
MGHGLAWDAVERQVAAKAFLAASQNCVRGADQKTAQFISSIHRYVIEFTPKNSDPRRFFARTPHSIFKYIKSEILPDVQKFSCSITKVNITLNTGNPTEVDVHCMAIAHHLKWTYGADTRFMTTGPMAFDPKTKWDNYLAYLELRKSPKFLDSPNMSVKKAAPATVKKSPPGTINLNVNNNVEASSVACLPDSSIRLVNDVFNLEANGTLNGTSNGTPNGNQNGHSNGISNVLSNDTTGVSNGVSNGISYGSPNGVSTGISNGVSYGTSYGVSYGTPNVDSNVISNVVSSDALIEISSRNVNNRPFGQKRAKNELKQMEVLKERSENLKSVTKSIESLADSQAKMVSVMQCNQLHKNLKVLKLRYKIAKQTDPSMAEDIMKQMALLSDKIIATMKDDSNDEENEVDENNKPSAAV